MKDLAWACKITRANRMAIASENPKFDLVEFEKWLSEHEVGFFVRDPSSVFDCRYFSDVTFNEMYIFARGDEDALFRRIIKR